jgi:hypothetical protein
MFAFKCSFILFINVSLLCRRIRTVCKNLLSVEIQKKVYKIYCLHKNIKLLNIFIVHSFLLKCLFIHFLLVEHFKTGKNDVCNMEIKTGLLKKWSRFRCLIYNINFPFFMLYLMTFVNLAYQWKYTMKHKIRLFISL